MHRRFPIISKPGCANKSLVIRYAGQGREGPTRECLTQSREGAKLMNVTAILCALASSREA
jgi:hypothetical protein